MTLHDIGHGPFYWSGLLAKVDFMMVCSEAPDPNPQHPRSNPLVVANLRPTSLCREHSEGTLLLSLKREAQNPQKPSVKQDEDDELYSDELRTATGFELFPVFCIRASF